MPKVTPPPVADVAREKKDKKDKKGKKKSKLVKLECDRDSCSHNSEDRILTHTPWSLGLGVSELTGRK